MKQEHKENNTAVDSSSRMNVAILDSGGWTLKYGLTHTADASLPSSNNVSTNSSNMEEEDRAKISAYRIMPNATGKLKHQISVLVGDEIHSIKNKGKLVFQRPLERGYCTDWGTQLSIWSRALLSHPISPLLSASHSVAMVGTSKKRKLASPSSKVASLDQTLPSISNTCCFILTQPCTPLSILENMEEILFKDLEFGSIIYRLAACMAAYRYNSTKRLTLERQGKNSFDPITNMKMLHDRTVQDISRCCLVVDSGFSCTHVVPTYKEMAILKGIRRVNIGGKLLTNHLKEVVSYRQWNMMDEFVLINDAKEKLCYVSTSFDNDLKNARGKRVNDFDRDFVLPNFVDTFEGSVRIPITLQKTKMKESIDREVQKLEIEKPHHVSDDDSKEDIRVEDANNDKQEHDETNDQMDYDSEEETNEQRLARIRKQKMEEIKRHERELMEQQVLSLSVERFTVPEMLFRPQDIGLNQDGLCSAIVQSVESCDEHLRAALYRNILLVGGNAQLEFFRDRIEQELRSIVASKYAVRVFLPHDDDPIGYSWNGAKDYINSLSGKDLSSLCKDRASWEKRKSTGSDVELNLIAKAGGAAKNREDFCIL